MLVLIGLYVSCFLNVLLLLLLLRKKFRYKGLRRERFEKRLEKIINGQYLMSGD